MDKRAEDGNRERMALFSFFGYLTYTCTSHTNTQYLAMYCT
jgi:hypothetical protein